MSAAITSGQLKRLQVLYSQHARRSLDATSGSREERLDWATRQTGRLIASFKELTLDEGKHLIELLQRALNVKAPSTRPSRRDDARRAGLDGRHDGKEYARTPKMASAQDIEVIERFYQRLGWTRERFDAWLQSPRSPLGRKSNPQIRTLADANRVRWALKGMLVSAGLWEERNVG
jgi:hypothetical protein